MGHSRRVYICFCLGKFQIFCIRISTKLSFKKSQLNAFTFVIQGLACYHVGIIFEQPLGAHGEQLVTILIMLINVLKYIISHVFS